MTRFDPINNPPHYTAGRRYEVIDIIEDWAQFAPSVKEGIALGSALKYLGRLWSKDDGVTATPQMNLRKAQWYLDRLMQHMIDEEESDYLAHVEPTLHEWTGQEDDDPDDPYNHPDTVHFGDLDRFGESITDVQRHIGLVGGISDGDLTDEDWKNFYDYGYIVDVDRPGKDVRIDRR